MPHPLFALFFQVRIVHERRIRIRRRLLLFLRHQIGCNVFRILGSQPQARHHRHVLYLQFVPVVGTLAVVKIKLIGKILLRVIFGSDVFLFIRTIGPRALTRVVNPAHQVVVVRFLADAG